MAVTDGGGRNSLENNLQDFQERYNHEGAKAYKQRLLGEVSSPLQPRDTTTTTTTNKNKNTNGGSTQTKSKTGPSASEKERIYELSRLDPDLPWHAPIPSVATKLLLLGLRILLGIPALPLTIVFCLARFVLYPHNALLQGMGWMLVGVPLVGMFLFGRKLCRDFVHGRIPPFKSAQNLLAQRMEEGRAIRTGGYDVFLPPPSETKDDRDGDDEPSCPGLILYPGWLINHTSYAPIASKLSDSGILVVVVSMEPFRASVVSTRAETARTLKTMYELLAEVAPERPVSEWALGGHGTGGHLAMKIARATSPGTSRLVLWGCGTRPIDRGSASLHDNKTMRVLVLNGSEDGSIKRLPFHEQTAFRKILPETTEYRTLQGGNHNGFGHYEKPKNQKRDGVRTITLDEQQRVAVEETVRFLNGIAPQEPPLPKAESSKKNE
eukprot:CAMPEP_0201176410 /NCGR_PEP_ID=MMETSP0851-20130426/104892_1 /ASSEMBLY_ACC=CAM_ASM_000631 /TAXON_ID=183588 /ORGANISM="Pseudo-nitzschia fraudulenta, Strain WWA7" /LENGTH=436 /DNA_ID=CAMNT_0047459805 /DNA_START=164 /DNA_END=1474 /DNA_ORIENTATION=-